MQRLTLNTLSESAAVAFLQTSIAFASSERSSTQNGLDIRNQLSTIEPDVEALLISRRCGRTETECWIVPVDACYELVGRIRRHWRGFEGGEEAWVEIDAFFAGLGARESEDLG